MGTSGWPPLAISSHVRSLHRGREDLGPQVKSLPMVSTSPSGRGFDVEQPSCLTQDGVIVMIWDRTLRVTKHLGRQSESHLYAGASRHRHEPHADHKTANYMLLARSRAVVIAARGLLPLGRPPPRGG